MSRFTGVEQGPPIEGFALNEQFAIDTFPNKVNLGVGAYRTNEGQPWVLPVVRAAEKALAADEKLNKEYLPVLGLNTFTTAATKMLLGSDSYYARQYRHWSPSTRSFDLAALLEDLNNAPENSVIILHACAHNPTGCDPTQEQWVKIADVMEKRKLFPFFDSAYQRFASGDLEKDAWAVRYFVSRRFELLCAQSFAKNFGLYNERVGNLAFVVNNPEVVGKVKSQVTLVIRGMYSNPPSHGARIVAHVLNDPALFSRWKECIKTISIRITEMRKALRAALEKLKTPGDWSHITTQIGMFSFTGFNEKQSLHMVKKYHIYMFRSGRISMCGATPSNVDYVAKAIRETIADVE